MTRIPCPSESWDQYCADQEQPCVVCGKEDRNVDGCDCPECPECGEVGYPDCYIQGHMPYPADSVQALVDRVGVSDNVGDTLRAIDKYNAHHVFLVLFRPHPLKDPKFGCGINCGERQEVFDALPTYTRYAELGVGGIAWDGSDWEFTELVPAGDWEGLEAAETNYQDAVDEHRAEAEADFEDERRAQAAGGGA